MEEIPRLVILRYTHKRQVVGTQCSKVALFPCILCLSITESKTMAYSIESRRRILKMKEQCYLTYEETARRFGIGVATLVPWNRRLEPKQNSDRPSIKIDMEALARDVEKHPDSYQYERAKRFSVSQSGIARALKRLNISYKRNDVAPQSKRGKTSGVSRTYDIA